MNNIFLVCIGMLTFIVGSLILKKDKSKSDYIIILWSFLAILNQIGFYYVAVGEYKEHIRFSQIVFGSLLLHAPLLFFYVQAQLVEDFKFQLIHLLHFTPIVIFYLLHIPEFSQNVGISMCSKHFGCYISNSPCSIVSNFSKIMLNIFYLMLTFFTYKNLVKPFEKRNSEEKVKTLWVQILLTVSFSLIILITLYRLLEVGQIRIFDPKLFILNVIGSIYIFVFSFIGINFTGIIDFIKVIKKSIISLLSILSISNFDDESNLALEHDNPNNTFGLNQEDIKSYLNKLSLFMEEKKPFLELQLNRSKLAQMVGIPAHHLAHIIKLEYNQTFTEYINKYRLDHLLDKIEDHKYENYTLLALAYDCGFNSKSTFNRCFKSHFGTTPSDFLKMKQSNIEISPTH